MFKVKARLLDSNMLYFLSILSSLNALKSSVNAKVNIVNIRLWSYKIYVDHLK